MHTHRIAALVLSVLAALSSVAVDAATETRALPAGTRLYLVTDREVSSKRGEADVGTVVPCRIWRDVEVQGVMFFKGGTLASCRVDKVKRSNMGGIQGKVSIAGVETRSADGQVVMLGGGYNKEGSGRKAVVWTVGLLLLWPVLFVPGGAAELPPGTVFDVETVNELRVGVAAPEGGRPRLNLAGLAGGPSAEVLLEEFLKQEKPEVLKVKLTKDGQLPPDFFIDSVNGKPIDPLQMKVLQSNRTDDGVEATLETKIKPLAKHFQKGINRFEVAYKEGGERRGTEVILDIQM